MGGGNLENANQLEMVINNYEPITIERFNADVPVESMSRWGE